MLSEALGGGERIFDIHMYVGGHVAYRGPIKQAEYTVYCTIGRVGRVGGCISVIFAGLLVSPHAKTPRQLFLHLWIPETHISKGRR